MLDMTPSLARQHWLEVGVAALAAERFAPAGYTVPKKIRCTIGFPKGASMFGCKTIGQCWAPEACSDYHAEVFVSPELDDPVRILGTLAHELVHATVGNEAGHRKPFKQCALAIGLVGPMRATTESEDFKIWAAALIERIGVYPAGFLTVGKKQTTRMMKCQCAGCGYVARVARIWLGSFGPPICPADKVPMAIVE